MKYKVGDKVRIVSEKVGDNWNDSMNKWLGKVMTIEEICGGGYRMIEDKGEKLQILNLGWFWEEYMIECKVEDENQKPVTNYEYYKDKLKDLDIGNYCEEVYETLFNKCCEDLECHDCVCNTYRSLIDFMNQEVIIRAPVKLTQFEYDSLSCCDENKRKKKFNCFTMCMQLKHKGYYKGVHDVTMTVEEIMNNCEIENEKI